MACLANVHILVPEALPHHHPRLAIRGPVAVHPCHRHLQLGSDGLKEPWMAAPRYNLDGAVPDEHCPQPSAHPCRLPLIKFQAAWTCPNVAMNSVIRP